MIKPCDNTTKGRNHVHRVPHDCGRCICGIRLFYRSVSGRLGYGSKDLGVKVVPTVNFQVPGEITAPKAGV